MKVLVLAPWKAAIIQRLVYALQEKGVEVIVASHDVQRECGVESLGPLESIFSYFKTQELNKLIDKHKPDIIHAHYATHYGVMAALQKKVPYVLALWGSDIMVAPVQGGMFKRFFYKWLISVSVGRASLCHSSSEHVCKMAAELSGKPLQKFKTFFWGVIPEKLTHTPSSEAIEKMDFDFGLAERNIVLCGRGLGYIYQPERVGAIIRQHVSALAKKNIVFVVLRVSASDSDVDKFRRQMMGFKEQYIFINRMLNEEELAYLYHKSLVHISIPLSDSLGGGVVEPAMWGSFPILSDLPGNKGFIKNYFGILDSDENVNLVMKKAKQDVSSTQVLKVKEDMSIHAVVGKVLDIYEEGYCDD